MSIDKQVKRATAAAGLAIIGTVAGPTLAQQATDTRTGATTQEAADAPIERRESTARKHVDNAVAVVRRMASEPRMNEQLQKAKAVFIVPTYGRAALGVGASGGTGVLLVKSGDVWSEPVFYNLGGLSAGAQAGAEGGAIAMLLNNDKAVDRFMQKNAFSLNADAGLTIVNWSKIAQGSVGTGDVVAWAGTKGLFGNLASIGINDIRFNQNLTDAYYRLNLSPRDVVTGRVRNAQAEPLKQALASIATGQTSGASTSGSQGSGKSEAGGE